MSGRSIRSFIPPAHKNLSIIDAMSNCSRIRKNFTHREQTENRQRTDRELRTEKPITEAPLITVLMGGQMSRPKVMVDKFQDIFSLVDSFEMIVTIDQ